ncbi:DEAD/DEAH box helicase [Nocardioides iriomotensis]|uniref:Probable helicase HelY n=1 Tax=Nocardioides iriomotensis TaxID=715784 RepID=A0A4Q5J1R1_9ACTN|nr:DEAD/DEAH box helicase [Nocardioides iriomotensis]RYU11568.1 DEAD/DEAH box helicase [Nocardioides iriomotensis]
MAGPTSPSERYAAFRRGQETPAFTEFARLYDFPLDEFQVRACHELEAGNGVLVAAPTGSGKTLVGEFAVHLALAQGRKCFYTTPIKALSNQKYNDLVRRYGADKVGLLTGDNTVNGEAPVVVMTTEVLRNMLYAGSRTLDGLGYVVMDEVHYLADRFRGAVWEEVIIHLPESVALVSLSATVSNAEEFGEWLETVRGATTTIVEERRPVPLYQHVMVGRRMYDLFADDTSGGGSLGGPDAKVNPELFRVARDDWRAGRAGDRRRGKQGKGGRGGRDGQGGNRSRRPYLPSRYDVVEKLDAQGLLPAIVFIFSRVGCDAAVQQCLNANLRLTSPAERDEIFRFVEDRCRDIPEEDLHVLGYHDFVDGLSRGIAAHHAGMLPRFKECVEELFATGRCKVVFATETLALGINMPARSVVLEKLSKWNGETHADITPGEYTQLTGRAGRRGIDVEGHGVVLWQPGLEPKSVAGLASTRTYPLKSSFRPSYNMAVNLVHQVGRATARELLESSFAQFQADKAVVGLARQLRKAEEALAGYAEAATCDKGDFMEYAGLRRRLSQIESEMAKARRADRREEVVTSLEELRPGDVIEVPAGRFSGMAVVIDPGVRSDRDGPRPYVLTADRHARRLSLADFPVPVAAFTRLRIPKSFNGRNPQARRDLASTLRQRTHGLTPPPGGTSGGSRGRGRGPEQATEKEVPRIREQLRAHPCHACPDREDHARWAERHAKLDRDTNTLRRRIEQRTNTIARQFDRVCEVLTDLGYLDGDTVTEAGARLRRIYTDMDLVAAECLRNGLWDDLGPSGLAAALSALVFEARRPDDAQQPRIPGGPVKQVLADTVSVWADLDALEREHKLDFLREPDLGFAWAAYRWAEGALLDEVLKETDLAAGDFVRWMKQLLDLTDQVADAAGDSALRKTARASAAALRRGVVAYSMLAD